MALLERASEPGMAKLSGARMREQRPAEVKPVTKAETYIRGFGCRLRAASLVKTFKTVAASLCFARFYLGLVGGISGAGI
ncbi:hypothetical protein QWZ13_15575 [Reinekea marina]|uniref:hypothetical protein n=1 Tax=Reinekea marina TaxID=1310421 RepID=UPI0025B42233|nr:hypothetical protein [Reinekea marina]MDN3650326.1 hypothetical protein [Reinekea marina]